MRRGTRIHRAAAILPAILLGLAPATTRAASFMGLGDLPGGSFSSQATGISADGSTVVGTSHSAAGTEAFVWDAGHGMRGPGDLPGWTRSSASPTGVSADGAVVVGNGGNFEGFIWDATDGMRGLGGLPGSPIYSEANGVSADGSMVVGRVDSDSAAEAYRWDATNGMRTLGDLPGGAHFAVASAVSASGTTIVGQSESGTGLKAFIWDSTNGMQELGDLPGASLSAANAVSADGSTVVGGAYSDGGYDQAFIWDAAQGMRGLGYLPGAGPERRSQALSVSSDGSVVVGFGATGSGASNEAFIWDAENGMRSLAAVLSSLGIDLSDWTLDTAVGISADGRTIVGYGSHFGAGQEAWIAVIPEPATALMLGMGLAGLAAPRRKP